MLAEDFPSNVAPVYSRMQSLKPGKLSGDGLHRYAAQLPVPRERLVSLGEGSTPLVSIGTLGREFGLRRLMIKDERRNPTGSWRDRFAALAVSQHAGADATVGTAGATRWRWRWRLRRSRRAALGRAGGRDHSRRAAACWTRSSGWAGARWACPGWRRAGRCWPTPSGRWAGGRSRTAAPRRSAATRSRSRATARSPTRSPSSWAGRCPTWWPCPRRWATASRASGAASATWPRGGWWTRPRGWWRWRWAGRSPARWPAARTGSRPAATCTAWRGHWAASPAPSRRCRRWSSRRAWWCG